ncbi:MAG: aminopeptidase [Alphaproteobacteria bacterium]|nr:MAG: aminopeptidase [Alphaproteobacteria bacterium]
MNDADIKTLFNNFLETSLDVKEGQNLWLHTRGYGAESTIEIVKDVLASKGVKTHFFDNSDAAVREVMAVADQSGNRKGYLETMGDRNLRKMKEMDAFLAIGGVRPSNVIAPPVEDLNDFHSLVVEKASMYRVKQLPWLVATAPTEHFARACGMTGKDFDGYYLNACMAVTPTMEDRVEPLYDLLLNGKNVQIKGKDTDIEFSIDGIGAKKCIGYRNRPDGECYTAPVKDSVNGEILYTKSTYAGTDFPWIKLSCEQGRIVSAESDGDALTVKLNDILNQDDGARYFGEFAIAFNPIVDVPVGNILFDEKIKGSFHLTPGTCYTDFADNGNTSVVHWDMVQIQRSDHGGGTIVIDDELIRKDGLFVPKRLRGLNPENLVL